MVKGGGKIEQDHGAPEDDAGGQSPRVLGNDAHEDEEGDRDHHAEAMGDGGGELLLGRVAKGGTWLLGTHGGTLGGSLGVGKTEAQEYGLIVSDFAMGTAKGRGRKIKW